MHKVTLTYYQGDLIPQMLFDTPEALTNFEATLSNYLANKEAIAEFKDEIAQYACLEAVFNAIRDNVFYPEGPYSEKLIGACETMSAGYEGLPDDECYKCVYNYILHYIYPNLPPLCAY